MELPFFSFIDDFLNDRLDNQVLDMRVDDPAEVLRLIKLAISRSTADVEVLEIRLAEEIDAARSAGLQNDRPLLLIGLGAPSLEKSITRLCDPSDHRIRAILLSTKLAGEDEIGQIETQIGDLLNEQRLQWGVKPLKKSGALSSAARRHCLDLSKTGVAKHSSVNGDRAPQRAFREGYNRTFVWECIAFGLGSAHEIMNGWCDSPGHRAVLQNPYLEHWGVSVCISSGCAVSGVSKNVYSVLNIGGMSSSTAFMLSLKHPLIAAHSIYQQRIWPIGKRVIYKFRPR